MKKKVLYLLFSVAVACGLWLYENGANRNDAGKPQSFFQWDEENDMLYRVVNGEERTFALVWTGDAWGIGSVSKAALLAGDLYNGKPMYRVGITDNPSDLSAATGDNSMVDLGVALMLVSMMSVVALVGKKKFF